MPFIITACDPGYYGVGLNCTMCEGNKIKSADGDAPDCDVDPPCEGATFPNDGHTACCKYRG